MAHSNHYYRQVIQPNSRHIDLLSRHEIDDEGNDINYIQMIIHGPVYGTTQIGDVGIWLTEKEQDELIAGILERRGIQLIKMDISEQWVEIPITPIDPYGQQQSTIHPAKLIKS